MREANVGLLRIYTQYLWYHGRYSPPPPLVCGATSMNRPRRAPPTKICALAAAQLAIRRMRNLFTYSNEFVASIPREEKQRVNRVDPGICGELACRRYSCFFEHIRLSFTQPTTHRPLCLLNCHHLLFALTLVFAAVLYALGALTAVVGIWVGGDVGEPLDMGGALRAGSWRGQTRDWLLIDAGCLPLLSRSMLISSAALAAPGPADDGSLGASARRIGLGEWDPGMIVDFLGVVLPISGRRSRRAPRIARSPGAHLFSALAQDARPE
ncbi:hypothetical protein B0H15DRAFT_1024316 [Mycena belliarum]|uniref:Uncharacterized protein n=1 Tax=Mycena belliarum TaxID=1033014 RepID=A0AAD6XND9_9AGAR|nr:hypothetical protein B0H15DRAFT_1024316 [Mycena belliae]